MSHPLYARDRDTGTMVELEAESLGGGKYALAIASAGTSVQAIPDQEDPQALVANWGGFADVNTAGGDFVTAVAGLNGQSITVLSGSPFTTGESNITNTKLAVKQPCTLEVAASFVRTGISFATACLFANEAVTGNLVPDPVPAPINIVSYYQSSAVQGATNTGVAGTVMHMLLETALPDTGSNNAVYAGDWITISGLADSRFNYCNATINYISPDRKTIAIGFRDEVALPSVVSPASGVTTPTLGTAKVNFYNNVSGARNAFGMRLTGATATSAAVVSIFGGDDNQVSGTLLGDHRVTIASSAPTYVAGAAWGQYEVRNTTRYAFDCSYGASVLLDKPEQTQAQWTPRDIPRTSVKPSSEALLFPRFRLFKPISMSRPVAKMVSAAHAAASNVTVVTMDIAPAAAGLVVGNWVTLRGNRDQTNFANSSTAVQITALDEGLKQITIAWGSAAIATGYGGSVNLINGAQDVPGIIPPAVQSVQSRVAANSNWLDVVGNATWTGVNPGDYVDTHGLRDATTGADLGLDGPWEVAHISTTTMVLKPVFNIASVRLSPVLGTLALTNCGGNVILRPTLRSHDLSLAARGGEQVIGLDGQGTTRADKAMPAVILGTVTISGTVTANTAETTLITGSNYNVVTAATTNAAVVKATAGTLYGGYISNLTAAAINVKLFNKATTPVPGTDVPLMVVTVPANADEPIDLARIGKRFSAGIGIAVTAGAATADATAVTAGALINLDYI